MRARGSHPHFSLRDYFAASAPGPMSIEELEDGLLSLDRGNTDLVEFWDRNILSFRQTVLFAIRETSDALLTPKIPRRWRVELQDQLEGLVGYINLADRYIASRFPQEARAEPTTH